MAEVVRETPRVASLLLDVPGWSHHLAGQHIDVRLTAEDGYQAQRSYSIASAPEDARLAITVERLEDGEVSPYLVGELRAGDQLELRGPIGGYFVWRADEPRPLLLIAGGSGVVPLMAMLRHRAHAASRPPARLLYSSRAHDDIIYRAELDRLASSGDGLTVSHTLTRGHPAGWHGYTRRLDRSMIDEVAWPKSEAASVFICGPTSFVESAAELLVDSGYDAGWIKTERFGATGG
ncbi:MAG TPA: ferredoxin reductase [Candidatus Dormibacteraeota bacterium]|nr:ferredoxin reductase [Candidatus Dormibacteraeota bacterium]